VTRLATPIDLQPRLPGKYLSSAAGIPIPVDQTFFTARIERPDPLLLETAWPDRGPGGLSDPHAFDNDKVQCLVGGLDTEVLRAYFFVSLDDGLTWFPWGHVGTTGGHKFNRLGAPILETTFLGVLPGVGLPNRRIQVALDVREALSTKVEIDVDDRALPPIISRDLHQSIAVESTAGGGAAAASSVSTSGNLTPAGLNRYLVAFGGNHSGPVANYTSIVFGAVTQTQITNDAYTANSRLASAGDIAPSTTGALVTYTIDAADSIICVGAVAFSGVDQTTPRDTPPTVSSGVGSAPSHAVTAGDTGDVRVAGMFGLSFNSGITVGSGETSRVEVESISGQLGAMGISTKDDGAADAMDWNETPAGAEGWGMRGFNINAAAAGPTITQHPSDQARLIGSTASFSVSATEP